MSANLTDHEAATLRTLIKDGETWITEETFEALSYEELATDADAGRRNRSLLIGGKKMRLAKATPRGRRWAKGNRNRG